MSSAYVFKQADEFGVQVFDGALHVPSFFISFGDVIAEASELYKIDPFSKGHIVQGSSLHGLYDRLKGLLVESLFFPVGRDLVYGNAAYFFQSGLFQDAAAVHQPAFSEGELVLWHQFEIEQRFQLPQFDHALIADGLLFHDHYITQGHAFFKATTNTGLYDEVWSDELDLLEQRISGSGESDPGNQNVDVPILFWIGYAF